MTPEPPNIPPLDQINAANVKNLQIAWQWHSDNFGKLPDHNWEVTPLMVGGILYFTAGTRRDAVAVDAATGETLWMYRLDEGARGNLVARTNNRGLAYWTDGKGDNRILLISPGYQLVALDAKTGRTIPGFGTNGIVDLTQGLDRAVVKPGVIGASSPAIVVSDTVVVGAALLAGTAPPSKENVPGYIRGFDVRTGKKLWTFHTIAQPGESGNETWENDSWKYTGNTGAWAPLSADEELGYVYLPVEMPTGDFYGGTRTGNNLFSDSLVCLDARTGKTIWYYQLVHHDIWDWDIATAPLLHRYHRRWQKDQGCGANHQAGVHLCLRPRDRQAGLAHRGTPRPAVRRARREDLRHAAVPDQAARLRPPGQFARRSDRLHAGTQRRSHQNRFAVQDGTAFYAAHRGRYQRQEGPIPAAHVISAAPTGQAARPTRRRG